MRQDNQPLDKQDDFHCSPAQRTLPTPHEHYLQTRSLPMVRSSLAIVPAKANSLYITTLPLIGDSFHWSFMHIDNNGICTRHHWAPITHDMLGREDYIEEALPIGALNKARNLDILGYFRVSDYRVTDIATFRELCKGIFTEGFPTVVENRKNRITCRTWLTKVVEKLTSPERAQEIEQGVTSRSQACGNEYASTFLRNTVYTTVVEDV